MENGYPKYTDLILNNPDGLSVSQALGKYTRGSTPSPGFIDGRYHEQYWQLPQQKEAGKLWAEVADNALEVLVPPITSLPEEAEEISTIMATVDSYREEMAVKFIMGQESLDHFDKFVAEMEKMNIKRAIELKQAALDRYNKR
jgi:putative aldouronate transport system substrate-binding protein